jgi:hypothetical protein
LAALAERFAPNDESRHGGQLTKTRGEMQSQLQYTWLVLRARSFGHAARMARRWIETEGQREL